MKYRIKNQTFQPIRLLDDDNNTQILLLPRKSKVFNKIINQYINLAKKGLITIKKI